MCSCSRSCLTSWWFMLIFKFRFTHKNRKKKLNSNKLHRTSLLSSQIGFISSYTFLGSNKLHEQKKYNSRFGSDSSTPTHFHIQENYMQGKKMLHFSFPSSQIRKEKFGEDAAQPHEHKKKQDGKPATPVGRRSRRHQHVQEAGDAGEPNKPGSQRSGRRWIWPSVTSLPPDLAGGKTPDPPPLTTLAPPSPDQMASLPDPTSVRWIRRAGSLATTAGFSSPHATASFARA